MLYDYEQSPSFSKIIEIRGILREYEINPVIVDSRELYFNIENQGYNLEYQSESSIGPCINLWPMPFGGVSYFANNLTTFKKQIEKLGAIKISNE